MDNRKQEIIGILEKQNSILDEMIECQKKIHDDVMNRNWIALEDDIQNVRLCSDSFVVQDAKREEVVGTDKNIYYTPEVEPLYTSVKSKLTRSKVENAALSTYVNATRSFIDGVLTECIPQERNVLYSPKGIRKTYASSVLVNTVY